ncbi:AGE family epimerase/isomerase [Diaminobutyricibacter tongyongensis]|uniref:AGE family epimerase/isomerase n=1 Tax=Leifsonia tongyongensis TaxID=1268043 RepID=A0A6L9XVA3_9MICO|nr:AGE family epimerase/isomerase [Diaminobutyricibacter tongyongensis]NEN05360.1 AGE family epimerase/isomerase [Diaminobutyricibacter tongyongensis]
MMHSTRPGSPQYLRAEGERLLAFARNARLPEWGYGWLDSDGSPMADDTVHTYLTARMTHVFSLAVLLGHEWAAEYADHGIAALTGPLHDDRHGGWYTATDRAGRPLTDEKAAYPHTFVLLAAASATSAGRPGAAELLAQALGVIERRFREPESGLLRERWDRSWSSLDTYRGGNSNMHAVEALLAASDATGDPALADRALEIAAFLVNSVARNTDWRIVEHFDSNWSPALRYNEQHPADPFRPFGSTVGHGIEWSRLLLHMRAARPDADWLLPAARQLFARAQRDGWNADGHEGFLYTVDWEGRPVVTERLHWVLAEALGATAAMHQVTGNEAYRLRYDEWWHWAEDHFIDRGAGSWHHELDATGHPASTVKKGKADVYHAFQATLLPRLPLTASLASAIRSSRAVAALQPPS